MEINVKNVLRYMGVRGEADENTLALALKAIELGKKIATPRMSTVILPVERKEGKLFVGGAELSGESAKKLLKDSQRAGLLTVTAGHAIDDEVRKLAVKSAALSLALDAVGTEIVEITADGAEEELKKALGEGVRLTYRFSPGYGDMPLDFNAAILRLTDAQRRTGVTGVDGQLLAPSKSVTAIVGVIED